MLWNEIITDCWNTDCFLQVLGQLDNKFIVTVVDLRSPKNQNVIVLFDQHAVHERIRLESLTKGWYTKNGFSFLCIWMQVNKFVINFEKIIIQ
jgi:DNA mismatch repair ATPase MutL